MCAIVQPLKITFSQNHQKTLTSLPYCHSFFSTTTPQFFVSVCYINVGVCSTHASGKRYWLFLLLLSCYKIFVWKRYITHYVNVVTHARAVWGLVFNFSKPITLLQLHRQYIVHNTISFQLWKDSKQNHQTAKEINLKFIWCVFVYYFLPQNTYTLHLRNTSKCLT